MKFEILSFVPLKDLRPFHSVLTLESAFNKVRHHKQ